MSVIVRRRYTTSDPNELLSVVARVFSSDFRTITILPGTVVATLSDEPPADPTLKDILADDDIVVIAARSPNDVLYTLWKHCTARKLVPYRCVVGGKRAADWLGAHPATLMLFGVPVRQDASVPMDDGEFMFLLADNPYGPINRVRKVLHGRVGEG